MLLLIAAWQTWDGVEARRFARERERVFPGGIVEPRQRPMRPDDAAAYYAAVNVAALGRAPDEGMNRIEPARAAVSRGEAPSPEDAEALARLVSAYALPLHLVREASSRPYFGDAPFVLEAAYRFTGLQPTGRAAGAETLQLIAAGDGAAALDSLVARVKFLRAYDGDRRTFAVFTKGREMSDIARDVSALINSATMTGPGVSALDAALAEAYDDDEIALALLDEARFQLPFLDGRRWLRGPRMALLERLLPLSFVVRPAARHVGVDVLAAFGEAVTAARRPWPERLHAIGRLEDRETPVFGPVLALPWRISEEAPRLASMVAAGLAAARATRLALAIERQRGGGVAPATLPTVELNGDAREYADPFTGGPLRYVRGDAGYVVYSVGRDFRDDGGTLTADAPATRAPGSVPPRDIGVRVDYRRAAATNASNNALNSPVR
jgi:hypothetical protein